MKLVTPQARRLAAPCEKLLGGLCGIDACLPALRAGTMPERQSSRTASAAPCHRTVVAPGLRPPSKWIPQTWLCPPLWNGKHRGVPRVPAIDEIVERKNRRAGMQRHKSGVCPQRQTARETVISLRGKPCRRRQSPFQRPRCRPFRRLPPRRSRARCAMRRSAGMGTYSGSGPETTAPLRSCSRRQIHACAHCCAP